MNVGTTARQLVATSNAYRTAVVTHVRGASVHYRAGAAATTADPNLGDGATVEVPLAPGEDLWAITAANNADLAVVVRDGVAATPSSEANIGIREATWTTPEAADADQVMTATAMDDTDPVAGTIAADPDVPRNLTVTIAGTAADVPAAGDIVVEGTNVHGGAISETFTTTENTTEVLTGDLAFATVTAVTLPVADGTGATVAVGVGDKLGLPAFPANAHAVLAGTTTLDGVVEGTEPTLAYDADDIEGNTLDLNSALDGTTVATVYLVEA